jgi:hypothetical protein
LNKIFENKNIIHLKDCPEKILPDEVYYHGSNYCSVSLPPEGDKFIKVLTDSYENPLKVDSSPFVAIDIYKNSEKETFVHILNYDNTSPQDVLIELNEEMNVHAFSPHTIGYTIVETFTNKGKTIIEMKSLHTYAVIKLTA